jgi:hypothetical protein
VLKPEHRRVSPFPVAASVGIEDKTALQNRLDNIAYRMMHDAITKWRCFNKTFLGIVDDKFAIAAMSIGFVRKIPA